MVDPELEWCIGPRSAWDQVHIGPFPTREAALRAVDATVPDDIAERIVYARPRTRARSAHYTVRIVDSETPPTWLHLCEAFTPGAQADGYFLARVTTRDAVALEQAFVADPLVCWYIER